MRAIGFRCGDHRRWQQGSAARRAALALVLAIACGDEWPDDEDHYCVVFAAGS